MGSLAYLVILLVVQQLHAAQHITKVENLVGDLAGQYKNKEFAGGHPSLVSIVKTGDTMGLVSVDLFPIETCQAVKICIGKNTAVDPNNGVGMEEGHCGAHIEYHPPTGFISIITPGQAEAKTGYATKLAFERSASSYQIDVSTEPYSRKATFQINKPVVVDLAEKTLMIFTNSRQCHAQVSFSGRSTYEDLMTPDNIEGNFPNVFEYAKTGQKTKTFFTHTAFADGQQRRTFDPLEFMKSYTKQMTQFGQLKFKCSTSGTGQSNREKITKHSVLIGQKVKNRNVDVQAVPATAMIAINTIECHWVRLWFTKKTKWQDYATSIGSEIHQTVDLFFHESFVLLPDRQNAIRLPGSSRQIQSISFVHHGAGLVEMSLGRVGNDYINPISFYLPIFKEETFNVFMIRSPNCDARFSQGTPKITGHHKANTFSLRNCEALMITPP